MTDKERTILDLFVAPSWAGTFESVYGILKQAVSGKMIDLTKLVGHAIRYGEGALAKRLGWCLEELGVSETIVRPLLEMKISGYRVLDPERIAHGRCNKRWMIIDNLAAGYETQLLKTS